MSAKKAAGFFQKLVIFFFVIGAGMIPVFIQGEDYNMPGLDSGRMERELMPGQEMQKEADWKNYSQKVKQQEKAQWEYAAAKEIAKKLGLTNGLKPEEIANLSDAAAKTAFELAEAQWENKADMLIWSKYGKWKAQRDWNISIDAAGIKQMVEKAVWESSAAISNQNIVDNIYEMKARMDGVWGTYTNQYADKLNSSISAMESGDIEAEARDSYIGLIEEYAKNHFRAVAYLGKGSIKTEEDKYLKYMSKISVFRDFADQNGYIFDESNNLNLSLTNVTNANSGVDAMGDPLTSVKTFITGMQTNMYTVNSNLIVPDTAEEDLEVGITGWEDMVRQSYRNGLDQWDSANESLLSKMNTWMVTANNGYIAGEAEWDQAYGEMTAARQKWLDDFAGTVATNIGIWNSRILEGDVNLSNSLTGLQDEIQRINADYDEYNAGMMKIFLEGSSTYRTMDNNLDWIGRMTATNRLEWNKNISRYTALSNQMANTNSYNIGMATGYYWTGFAMATTTITVTKQVQANTSFGAMYSAGLLEYQTNGILFKGQYSFSGKTNIGYMNGWSSAGLIVSNFTGGGTHIEAAYTTNYRINYEINTNFAGVITTNYGISNLSVASIETQNNVVSNTLSVAGLVYKQTADGLFVTINQGVWQEYGGLTDKMKRLASDYAIYTNETAKWAGMKNNYTGLIADSKDKLMQDLYSGELGDGVLSNSSADGADLYLRSEKEMLYAKQKEELKYLQERMEITKAVMEYSLLDKNLAYSQLAAKIAEVSNQGASNELVLKAATEAYSNANLLSIAASQTAESNASVIAEAKAGIDAAMADYEAAQKEYNKQQEIEAILEEGIDAVKAQSSVFINQAVGNYIAGLSAYNQARDSYYNLYQRQDFSQTEKDLYLQLTNLLAGLNTAESGSAAYANLLNNMAGASNKVDEVTAGMIGNAGVSGIWTGVEARMEGMLAVSNYSRDFINAKTQYLKTGDETLLSPYEADIPALNYTARKSGYISLSSGLASDFMNWAKMNPTNLSLEEGFKAWQEANPLTVTTNKELLYGAWLMLRDNPGAADAWTNDSIPREGAFDGAAADMNAEAGYVTGYLTGGTYGEEGIYNYLSANTPGGVNDWTAEKYNRWKEILLGSGGVLQTAEAYFDGGIYSITRDMQGMMENAKEEVKALKGWYSVIGNAGQDMVNVIDLTNAGTAAGLESPVSALTNLKGKFGSAVDQYIDEVSLKYKAVITGSYGGESALTNDIAVLKDTLNTRNADFQKDVYLLQNQDATGLRYLDRMYQRTSNDTVKTALYYQAMQAVGWDTLVNINSGAEAETFLNNRLAQLFITPDTDTNMGGILSGTVIEAVGQIKEEWLKRYVMGESLRLYNNGESEEDVTNRFNGFDSKWLKLAADYYDYARFMKTDLEKGDIVDRIKGLDSNQDYSNFTAGIADYRVYRGLDNTEKNLIDTGAVGLRDYLFKEYGDAGLLGAISLYTGSERNLLLGKLSSEINSNAQVLNDLNNEIAEKNAVLGQLKQMGDQGVLRSKADILTTVADLSDVADKNNAADSFDRIETISNRTVMLFTEGGNEALNEVYRMLSGFGAVVSNYNENRAAFADMIAQIKLGTNLTGGELDLMGYVTNGALDQLRGGYQNGYRNWSEQEDKMTVWATAYQCAINNKTNFLASPDYLEARKNFETNEQVLRSLQNNYYGQMDAYYSVLSNYYDTLAVSGQKKETVRLANLEYRKTDAVMSYALLPFVLGSEENAYSAAAVSNFVDPDRDYKEALSNYNALSGKQAALLTQIQDEKVIKADIQAKLDNYKTSYQGYLKLVDGMEKIQEKSGSDYKEMTTARDMYNLKAEGIFGNEWNTDPLLKSVAENVSKGKLTLGDFKNMMSFVENGTRNVMQGYGNYSNDAVKNDLYKLIFGVRTGSEMSNILSSNLTLFNEKYNEITNEISTVDAGADVSLSLTSANPASDWYNKLNRMISLLNTYKSANADPALKSAADSNITLLKSMQDSINADAGWFSFGGWSARATRWDMFSCVDNDTVSIKEDSYKNGFSGSIGNLFLSYANAQNANSWLNEIGRQVNWHNSKEFPYGFWYPVVEEWWGIIPVKWGARFCITGWGNNSSVDLSTWGNEGGDDIDMGSGTSDPTGDWRIVANSWKPYRAFGAHGLSGQTVTRGQKSSDYNQYMNNVNSYDNDFKDLYSRWTNYDAKNNAVMKYSMDVSAYNDTNGYIKSASVNEAFFDSIKANVLSISGVDIESLRSVFAAKKGEIILGLNSSKNSGRIDLNTILEQLKSAADRVNNEKTADIRSALSTNDNQGKLFDQSMAGMLTSSGFLSNNTWNIGSAVFRDMVQRTGNIKAEAYKNAKQQEAELQANKWYLQQNGLQEQENQYVNDMYNMIDTGRTHWDNATNQFLKTWKKWEVDYTAAYQSGVNQWTDKTNTLRQRHDEWMNMAVQAVGGGSMDFISSQFQDAVSREMRNLLADDLPEDVAKQITMRAQQAQASFMPKNSSAYTTFFADQVKNANYADVSFVMDGISRFGGGGSMAQQFDNEMRQFKQEQMGLSALKMKEEFRQEMKNTVENMNNSIERADKDFRTTTFLDIASKAGFAKNGAAWVKNGITVDSSILGDKKQDFSFADYQTFDKRIDWEKFTQDSILARINGKQIKYDMLLSMEREEAGKEVESLMKDFGDNHIGQAYSSSSTPDKYSDGDTGGELHRVTWASSWYGYLQNKGFEASKAPVWDKPIWSTYDESTGKNNGFSMSIFDVGKIGLSVALTATGAGALVAAAINAGVAIGHDVLNLAAGALDSASFGVNLLKNVITGAAGMLTTAFDPTGNLVNSMINTGISSTANLATSGLHLNASGQMDWSMTPTGWAQFGVSTLANFGAAAFNSGFSSTGQDFGSRLAQGAGNWAINSTANLLNKSWKTTASGGLDMSMSANDWKEAGMDIASSGANMFINAGLKGANGEDSLLAYGLTKSVDMAKYGAYQAGWLGGDLQNKYNNDNVFNLAGGLDLTIFQGNNGPGKYNGAVGLQINTHGVNLHEGAGEFSGLAMQYGQESGFSWKGEQTLMNDALNIYKGVKGIGNGVSWMGDRVNELRTLVGTGLQNLPVSDSPFSRAVNDIASLITPWNDPERLKQGQAQMTASLQTGENDAVNPRDVELKERTDSAFYQKHPELRGTPIASLNADQQKEYQRITGEVKQSGDYLSKKLIDNVDAKNDGNVILSSMTNNQFKQAMDDSKIGFLGMLGMAFTSTNPDSNAMGDFLTRMDDKNYNSTVKQLSAMDKRVQQMQKQYGGAGANGQVLDLLRLVDLKQSVILGEAGAGSRYVTNDENGNRFDHYDDLLSVLTKQGSGTDAKYVLGNFYRSNMNPTNSYEYLHNKKVTVNQQGENDLSTTNFQTNMDRLTTNVTANILNEGPDLLDGTNISQTYNLRNGIDGSSYWGELAKGMYGFDKEYSGLQGYDVLKVKDNYNLYNDPRNPDIGNLPAARPNPVQNNNRVISGVYFHKGGGTWNYSQGCQTIYQDDWNTFINMFSNWNSTTGGDGIYFKY